MADSYSVKAILSAQDSGFSSTLKKCMGMADTFGSTIGGINFGFLSGVGSAAFGALKNSVGGLISEISSSNASWKTFEGNMSIIEANGGKLEQSIEDAYVVTVTYEQMNVFAPLLENYMTTVEEKVNAWTEAALAGEATPSEDEMMDEVLAAFGTTLEEVLANVTYAEPQTMTVRIELVDGMYTPNESDLYNLEYALFDNDAVE